MFILTGLLVCLAAGQGEVSAPSGGAMRSASIGQPENAVPQSIPQPATEIIPPQSAGQELANPAEPAIDLNEPVALPASVLQDVKEDAQDALGRPLPPRTPRSEAKSKQNSLIPTAGGSITTVLGALGVVLGLFLLVAWLAKRSLPKSAGSLPKEVIEVLGKSQLAPKQTVHLVRVGRRLLLISLTATGAETLAEIDDPAEVDRLAGICQQNQPGSITETFQHVLSHFAREPAQGFLGSDDDHRGYGSSDSRYQREIANG